MTFFLSYPFRSGPKIGASSENVSPQTLKRFYDHFLFFFLNEPVPGIPQSSRLQKASRKILEELTACKVDIQQNITQKIDPTLKLIRFKPTTPIAHVLRLDLKLYTRFL